VSAVATETATVVRRPLGGSSDQRLFRPSEATLEDIVLGAWEALEAGQPAECPCCREDALAADGCAACGAHLS
jgi:hypothetical protein